MTLETLETEIENATIALLSNARELTCNEVSNSHLFILSEIKNTSENFFVLQRRMMKEGDKKIPVALKEIMPELKGIYGNLYDINLHIHKCNRKTTVIDIRYFLKTSLDSDYRKKIIENLPMLHSKIALPPWLTDGDKFDINWERQIIRNKWKMFWFRLGFTKHFKILSPRLN